MAKLPAGYVFNKRQLRILSPGKILYPFLSEHQVCLCLFLKTNASLPPRSVAEMDSVAVLELWRIRFDPGRLVLIRSIVIQQAQ